MNREIATKRLYSLGDFKNITFDDVVSDVSEELMFDKDFVSNVKFLQLVTIELAYKRYLQLVEEVPYSMPVEDAIEILENKKQETMTLLKNIVNGDTEE